MSTREELSPTPPLQGGGQMAPRTAPTHERGTAERGADERSTDESLEQVRNLLFGATMRDQDRRLGRVEERIAREIAALRSDVTMRLDSMREELSTEMTVLSRSLVEERAAREQIEESVAQRIEELRTSLDLRLEELRTEAGAAHQELHSQAQEQALAARDEGRGARAEDRREMARMFADMAAQLGASGIAPEARE